MIIVTAYYNIPSKYNFSFYLDNIQRLFRSIQSTQIIFFTDTENYNILNEFAGPNVTFEIHEFSTLDIFTEFPVEFWKRQITIDPEKYHTWQLGSIWANKSHFVKRASNIHIKEEWFIWVDAGSIRCDTWEPILLEFGKRNLPSKKAVYVQLLHNPPKHNFYTIDMVLDENRTNDDIQGYTANAIILFHRDFIEKYIEEYSKTLNLYDINGVCGTMDQYITCSLLSQNHTFIESILYDKTIHVVPDKWFFMFSVF